MAVGVEIAMVSEAEGILSGQKKEHRESSTGFLFSFFSSSHLLAAWLQNRNVMGGGRVGKPKP